MKRMVLATGLFLAMQSAHADPFEDLYVNTATSTAPNGKTTLYFINKDGTFENRFPNGRTIKGTYVWKDGVTACFTVTDPPPRPGEPATNCRPFPVTHHVGDTWIEKDSEGVAYTNSIRAGRQ